MIKTMNGGDVEQKMSEEEGNPEAKRRRRRVAGTGPKSSGACASAEMEELRRGLGMDDEEEVAAGEPREQRDALSAEEATEESMECGVCGEERGEGEEGRESVGIRAPQRVSKEDREMHERTHTPYRAWCPYCVKGRGRNTPHMLSKGKSGEEESRVPRISMDYFFMSEKDEKANVNPLIVMLDEETNDKYARAVGQKGLGEAHEMDWLIKDMSI